MSKRKVGKLNSSAAGEYIAKAREFAESMRRGLAAKQWDAAGLGAVHSVISSADALLAAYGGVRRSNPTIVQLCVCLKKLWAEKRSPPLAAISHSSSPKKCH